MWSDPFGNGNISGQSKWLVPQWHDNISKSPMRKCKNDGGSSDTMSLFCSLKIVGEHIVKL